MNLCFGDIVVVEGNLIGVIVKSWIEYSSNKQDKIIKHEVYVRYWNEIRTYDERVIQRYMVRHKYLSDEEIMYQSDAVNGR